MSPKSTGTGTGPVVVGIGSSAGGLEALEALFRAAPARTGLAYVVVTHLAAGQKSLLPEIIGRFTAMPVVTAKDGARVRADHVYVAPADATLTIEQGKLRLHPAERAHHERYPINLFLASLAEDQGERAVAVILSGSGSDGTLGLTAVKEQGGLTIAQGPDHAGPRQPGMPASAIATGFVDLVLPAEEIPGKLVDYVRRFNVLEALVAEDERLQVEGEAAATIRPREAICAVLREQVGHDFSGYKERSFLRRVQRRMQVLQLEQVEAYLQRLRQDANEIRLLFRDLLINVTGFFRDPVAFATLEQLVVPRLFAGKGADDAVRVWVPGCATGEEVYSLAILLAERADQLPTAPKIQVFATDIDEAALEVARAGRYAAATLESVSPERLDRFFVADRGGYAVTKPIRELCIFSLHSLIRDPPFSRLDLISCRNLLIYLNAETQARLFPVFHYALRPGGFLFLGSAEGVAQHGELFATFDRKARLFRRREHAGHHPPIRFPLSVPEARPGIGLGTAMAGGAARPELPAGPTLRRTVEAALLGPLAPAHVVINQDGEAVYHSARIGRYLELAPGLTNRQVLAMARQGLRLDLRLALEEVMTSRRPVTRERVAVELDGDRVQLINLTVAPLPSDQERGGPLYLALFTELGRPLPKAEAAAAGGQPTSETAAADANNGTAAVVAQLERELKETRERLQAMLEEHETGLEEVRSTNEELVSLNEELQSTIEELETSKEEIQSVNEEMQTVNAELNSKVEQLNQANMDLKNLFDSTRIALVFLDRRLVVRSFTPAATELFNLIPGDRGRPLTDITSHLDDPGLQQGLTAVLEGRELLVERRVSRQDGQAHYLMRILPYRDGAAVDGAIVTFVDVTALTEAEKQQRLLVHELNHRVRNMLAVIAAIARQTLARASSPAELEEAFMGRIEALARAYGLVTRQQWGTVALEDAVREELEPHLVDDDDGRRIAIKGPRVMLGPKAAVALGLVLHELATNAVKHGALATAEGRITIEWHLEERENDRRLVLDWKEAGGPPVRAPERKGFGSELIESEVDHDLGGRATTEFRPDGIAVHLVLPMKRLR